MYLEELKIKNVSSIENCEILFPFKEDRPLPTILVGKNGSGKTTALSFIANAILSLRGIVYDNPEIERGKVFRVRSSLNIRNQEKYYFSSVKFKENIICKEWQLIDKKSNNPDLSDIDDSWKKIKENDISLFDLDHPDSSQIEQLLDQYALLYFPADRFERAEWQNEEAFDDRLTLPKIDRIVGSSGRSFLSMRRLQELVEWMLGVILDVRLSGLQAIPLKTEDGRQKGEVFLYKGDSQIYSIYNKLIEILKYIFCTDEDQTLSLDISNRRNYRIQININKNDIPVRTIKSIKNISSGESALLCIFLSILQDFDLGYNDFKDLSEIKGVVLVDEIDTHLHPYAQHTILPKLMTLFPNVQFILTMHAPLALLGIEKEYGSENIQIIEMPYGNIISSEGYSEFQSAYETFSQTNKYKEDLAKKSDIPLLLTEGESDAILLSTAWKKLYGTTTCPFEILPGPGGAKPLNNILRQSISFINRSMLGLFDFDTEGYGQFKGLDEFFIIANCNTIKKHKNKHIYAMLLETPKDRMIYTKGVAKLLTIEHYFSDKLLLDNLTEYNEYIPGKGIYVVENTSKAKMSFARKSADFDQAEFTNFNILFESICSTLQLPKPIISTS